jgi:hypothetical protein
MILKLVHLRFTSQREDLHAEIGGQFSRCQQGRANAKDSGYNLFVVTAWLKYFKTVRRML